MTLRGERTLVILPTYNERDSLQKTISGVQQHLPAADVLVIDDGSPDGTGRIADTLAHTDPRIAVEHRGQKLGLGTAYQMGFRRALESGYRFVVEMDADGSHLAQELPRLFDAALSGSGLALGSRWVPGGRVVNWPWYRRWISRTGTQVARTALRSGLHDITSGFRVIDTAWLHRVDLDTLSSQGYGFQVELAWSLERMGCPITEIPITFVERTTGRSKMSLGIVAEALWSVLRTGLSLRFRDGKNTRGRDHASG
jgi:dolichol-phosphate mannosyltransferase